MLSDRIACSCTNNDKYDTTDRGRMDRLIEESVMIDRWSDGWNRLMDEHHELRNGRPAINVFSRVVGRGGVVDYRRVVGRGWRDVLRSGCISEHVFALTGWNGLRVRFTLAAVRQE